MKLRGLGLSLLLFAGCGEEGSDGPTTITVGDVFDYYGLGAGNCYRYEFSLGTGQADSVAEVRVSDLMGDNERNPYPGRDIREWRLTRTGGADTLIRIYEVVGGEVRILQESSRASTVSPQVTRFFDDPQIDGVGTPPVTLALVRGSEGTPIVDPPGRETTNTTPQSVFDASGMRLTGDEVDPETYVYDVFSETASELDANGTSFAGTEITVTISRGGETFNLSEFVAPGIGFVRFQDYTETDFQLLQFRVTRSDGSTEGDLTCS
ncbi:MAG: hypothetical protein AAGD10_09405 [Myxococcota bacterium]